MIDFIFGMYRGFLGTCSSGDHIFGISGVLGFSFTFTFYLGGQIFNPYFSIVLVSGFVGERGSRYGRFLWGGRRAVYYEGIMAKYVTACRACASSLILLRFLFSCFGFSRGVYIWRS